MVEELQRLNLISVEMERYLDDSPSPTTQLYCRRSAKFPKRTYTPGHELKEPDTRWLVPEENEDSEDPTKEIEAATLEVIWRNERGIKPSLRNCYGAVLESSRSQSRPLGMRSSWSARTKQASLSTRTLAKQQHTSS